MFNIVYDRLVIMIFKNHYQVIGFENGKQRFSICIMYSLEIFRPLDNKLNTVWKSVNIAMIDYKNI